jgi:uncharacterized membrane protein
MFFVAYNWNDIGRFAKFAMLEGIIVIAIVAYCRLGGDSAASKVSLLVATICLGVLQALYGQTYQTGADPWQLFFFWALLILPWAIIGRFAAIWIVWVALINVSMVLYYATFPGLFWFRAASSSGVLWLMFVFNTLVLVAWEYLTVTWPWLKERWAIRLLAIGSGVSLTWLVIDSIFGSSDGNFMPVLTWAIWLALIYLVYRRTRPDLFMLAGCCLSGITVSVTFLGDHMLNESAVSYLILGLLVIGMGATAAFWLKKVHQETQP